MALRVAGAVFGAQVLAAALIATGAAGAARGSDWPQWLGPDRDGVSRETTPVVPWQARARWTAAVGCGYTSPVVCGGRVFFGGHATGSEGGKGRGVDTIVCLDADTGTAIWKHSYECRSACQDSTGADYVGPRATPATDGRSIYTYGYEGHLLCLDVATGAVRWSKHMPTDLGGKVPFYGYCSSPLISGRSVIVEANAPGASYVAFDREDGAIVWRAGSDSASTASPVLVRADGRDLAVFVSDNVLAAHDVADGSRVWRVEMPWTTWMGAVAAGDRVFVSSASLKRGCALYRVGTDAPLWWARHKQQSLHCNVVLWQGSLYASDNTRTDYAYSDSIRSSLKCLDLATGEIRWTRNGIGWANVIVADGKLVALRETGELVVAEATPEAYRELGRRQVIDGPCWTIPVIAGGRLYVRNNEGAVACYDVGAEAATAARR